MIGGGLSPAKASGAALVVGSLGRAGRLNNSRSAIRATFKNLKKHGDAGQSQSFGAITLRRFAQSAKCRATENQTLKSSGSSKWCNNLTDG
jgi:hypothetical protein